MAHDNQDYEELYENSDDEDIIKSMHGTILGGECCYDGCHGHMKFDEICFICDTCHRSVHESIYYMWYTGRIGDVVWDLDNDYDDEDDDEYEELYGYNDD